MDIYTIIIIAVFFITSSGFVLAIFKVLNNRVQLQPAPTPSITYDQTSLLPPVRRRDLSSGIYRRASLWRGLLIGCIAVLIGCPLLAIAMRTPTPPFGPPRSSSEVMFSRVAGLIWLGTAVLLAPLASFIVVRSVQKLRYGVGAGILAASVFAVASATLILVDFWESESAAISIGATSADLSLGNGIILVLVILLISEGLALAIGAVLGAFGGFVANIFKR